MWPRPDNKETRNPGPQVCFPGEPPSSVGQPGSQRQEPGRLFLLPYAQGKGIPSLPTPHNNPFPRTIPQTTECFLKASLRKDLTAQRIIRWRKRSESCARNAVVEGRLQSSGWPPQQEHINMQIWHNSFPLSLQHTSCQIPIQNSN